MEQFVLATRKARHRRTYIYKIYFSAELLEVDSQLTDKRSNKGMEIEDELTDKCLVLKKLKLMMN
jgi:hypothetical protein